MFYTYVSAIIAEEHRNVLVHSALIVEYWQVRVCTEAFYTSFMRLSGGIGFGNV